MAATAEPPLSAEGEALAGPGRRPRPPSLLDAVLPIVVLIGLLALTIAFFGIDATNGPLQVALLLSAAFASLIAFKNGMNLFIPTSAVVMGGLAIARVPYGRYLRWVWPLLAMLAALTILTLGAAALLA
jgi:C4-dicarboxylate anaerobic carrier